MDVPTFLCCGAAMYVSYSLNSLFAVYTSNMTCDGVTGSWLWASAERNQGVSSFVKEPLSDQPGKKRCCKNSAQILSEFENLAWWVYWWVSSPSVVGIAAVIQHHLVSHVSLCNVVYPVS